MLEQRACPRKPSQITYSTGASQLFHKSCHVHSRRRSRVVYVMSSSGDRGRYVEPVNRSSPAVQEHTRTWSCNIRNAPQFRACAQVEQPIFKLLRILIGAIASGGSIGRSNTKWVPSGWELVEKGSASRDIGNLGTLRDGVGFSRSRARLSRRG